MCAKTSRSPSNAETAVYVRQAVEAAGSLRKAARRLGVSPAALSDIVRERHDHVSLRTENKVRIALGLSPLAPRIEVDPCPDCGSVHHGRCYGKTVAVRPVRQRTWLRWADAPVCALAHALRNRGDYPG